MIRKLLFIAIAILAGLHISTAQEIIPAPIRYYPLNDASPRENINRKDGTIHGNVQVFTDRFGNNKGAMRFSDQSYISTPDFFSGSLYQNGFTISFWLYIDTNYVKRTSLTPWLDTDPVYRAFYAMNSDQVLLGFYHRGDRAVLDRYVVDMDGTARNYGIWYWDPVNFTARQGWYHIFLSYQDNKMTAYLFYPNGQLEYALHYMGLQNLAQVTDWGIGGKSDASTSVIDDFKVYDQPLSKYQVRYQHSLESMPNGMYTVLSAFDSKMVWQSKGQSLQIGTQMYVQPAATDREATMQWVFEPSSEKNGVCKIRMAYFDRYLVPNGLTAGTYVVLGTVDSSYLDWIIEPTGDGYFFIKSASSPNLYMKSERISFSSSRSLQIQTYNSAEAPYYKWRFNLLYLPHELVDKVIESHSFELVDENNTVFSLVPETPFTGESADLLANRGPSPSLMSQYTFKRDRDNSYIIYNKSFYTKAIQPKNRTLANDQPVELTTWNSGWAEYFKFIVERTNPLGRRIKMRPVLAQSLAVYSGDTPTANRVILKKEATADPAGYEWQAFNNGGHPGANKQISTITPGIYKISTMLDGKCLVPKIYDWNKGANIIMSTYKDVRQSSFYWVVDYEKDNLGNPTKDGTYTLRLYGTDNIYMGTTNENVPEGERVKTIEMDRNHISLCKWFIEPTRDGTGSFYLQAAADRRKHLHSVNSTSIEMNEVEYNYIYTTTNINSYKWKLERIELDMPIEPGVYHISTAASADAYHVHPTKNNIKEGATIELGHALSGSGYEWLVETTADKCYTISLSDSTPKLYLHSQHNSIDFSTMLELRSYDSTHAVTYKWIIVPTDIPDVYYLKLVGNMENCWLHLFNNYIGLTSQLELYKYIDAVDDTYTWKFEKVR